MHQRLDEVIEARQQLRNSLKRQERSSSAAQSPRRKSPGTPRSFKEFNEEVTLWNERRKQFIEKEQEELARLAVEEVQDKPQISAKSKQLAAKVANGDLLERLTRPRLPPSGVEPSFKPTLSSKTYKLAKHKRQNVYKRLYTPTKPRPLQASSPARTPKKLRFPEEPTVIVDHSAYRINTGFGTACAEVPVNEVKFSSTVAFMLSSIK